MIYVYSDIETSIVMSSGFHEENPHERRLFKCHKCSSQLSPHELEKFAHRRILVSTSRVPYVAIYTRNTVCKDVSGSLVDARNHIAFNGISRTHNTPALEIALEYLSSPLSSRSRTLIPPLSASSLASPSPTLMLAPSWSVSL